MRIAISVDMEGISGTVSFKQIVAGNPEFERAQRLATADVNAAIAGAREGGATGFVVYDTHWLDAINLLIDELDDSAEYVGGQPFTYGFENAHFWRWLISRITGQTEFVPPAPENSTNKANEEPGDRSQEES